MTMLDLKAIEARYSALSYGKTGSMYAQLISDIRHDVAAMAEEIQRLKPDAEAATRAAGLVLVWRRLAATDPVRFEAFAKCADALEEALNG